MLPPPWLRWFLIPNHLLVLETRFHLKNWQSEASCVRAYMVKFIKDPQVTNINIYVTYLDRPERIPAPSPLEAEPRQWPRCHNRRGSRPLLRGGSPGTGSRGTWPGPAARPSHQQVGIIKLLNNLFFLAHSSDFGNKRDFVWDFVINCQILFGLSRLYSDVVKYPIVVNTSQICLSHTLLLPALN